jgi:plastocyanin
MKSLRLLSTLGVSLLLAVPLISASDSKGGVLTGTIEWNEGAVVYLKGVSGDYEAPERTALMDQIEEVFTPHLLAVQKGQTVRFGNSDPFTHNVHVYWGRRSRLNVAQGIGGHSDWIAPRSGEYLILCDIHRTMSAFIFVHDHPFFATVEPQSSTAAPQFKIEGIPAGTYTLVVVRDVEGKGMLQRQEQEVTIAAGKTTTVNIRF